MASSTYPQGTQRKQRSSEEAYAGPLDSPLSPNSTNLNKRQRRHQGPSEEQPSSDDIIITDFRVGGPVLCRLPAYGMPLGRNSPLEQAWEASLANDVHQVLQRHHVLVSEAHALVRHSCRHERTKADTIFVLARRRHPSDVSWYLAAVGIRHLCTSQGLPHVNVEIADPRGLQPVFSHPVEHDSPFLGLWSADLERRIADVLGQSDWLALELLRRGVSPRQLDNPITITVTIDEASELDWVDVREKLVAILDENRLDEVAVEIIRGVIRRGWTDEMCRPKDEEWGGKAVFGGSISPSRSTAGTGTLGGSLELQNPTGSWETFAFTCYHVVLPGGTSHPSLDGWSKIGIKPGDPTNHLTIDHPSYGDHLTAVRSWKEVIARNQSDSVYQSVKASIDDPEAFVLPYHMDLYNNLEQNIQELDKKIKRAEAFFAEGKALLGPVFAASGMRQAQVATEYGPSLDWALIKLNKARDSRNQVRSPSFSQLRRLSPLSLLTFKLSIAIMC